MSDLRMTGLNVVIMEGRLTRDPELTETPSGKKVCKFGLANGREERLVFVDITCWEKTAEYVAEHIGKGRPVVVEGRLSYSTWEDKETGAKRSKHEVIANRVSQEDWDSDGPQLANEKPDPEDDIPFG